MGNAALASGFGAIALAVSAVLLLRRQPDKSLTGLAYVVRGSTSHVRYLPVESHHSFTYPMLSLLVSVRALESGELDLGGHMIFAFTRNRWRLTALSPESYLQDDQLHRVLSISQKLDNLVRERLGAASADRLGDSWMLTMPSYLGFVGINPLTVHYCYDKISHELYLTILEVHNTFGERHVYLLEVGVKEDVAKPKGCTHSWTFPRQFHVSPFNDRGGFYICSLAPPAYPPRHPHWNLATKDTPRPLIRLELQTPTTPPQKKFFALQRTVSSTPLSTASLLSALATAPFLLFLSSPRIIYEAARLHFQKRLDVFARPEPVATSSEIDATLPQAYNAPEGESASGTIGWQPEGWMESWAHERLRAYLTRRVAGSTAHQGAANIQVQLISTRAGEPIEHFGPIDAPRCLKIHYRSPRFFTLLLLSPSPRHALLAGCLGDRLFNTSDDELFVEVLDPPSSFASSSGHPWIASHATSIRRRWGQKGTAILGSGEPAPSKIHSGQLQHWEAPTFPLLCILWLLCITQYAEEKVFRALGARFVAGDEPWAFWERAKRAKTSPDASGYLEQHQAVGSVRT